MWWPSRNKRQVQDVQTAVPPAAEPMLPAVVHPVTSPETIAIKDALTEVATYYAQRQRTLSSSLINPMSGAGGPADKSGFFSFMPYWLNSQQFIENICVQSWVASRFINMPVDDMFTKPREFDDDKFKAYAETVKADVKVAAAMRTARKYGTGLLWAVTKEASPEEPLDIKKIRPNDLSNLLVFDRYSASVRSIDRDINSPNFGRPEFYQLHIYGVGSVIVHASRVYRFDGMTPDTVNGWVNYERDWGISNLAHALVEIFNDASVIQAINHLVQEASIPVQKVQGLSDILSRTPAADELSVDERMTQVNMLKSIYRTLLMDANDSFERVGVTFSGLPDLMEKSSERLAMAAGISATRFLGKSPDGMNATGDGDQRNDNRTTRRNQLHLLAPAYKWLDPFIAASVSTVVPEYTFPPLFEPTQKELSDVIDKRADSAGKMVTNASWDENEARHYVSTGVLPTGEIEDAEGT